ncbi:MAG: hypothetical protein LBR62_01695 [Puniceicoccales bacterium]|jgi:membrane-bound ClpP family serine protease|nr:hypothetical protein [Puniceicoccales bacterium]
MDPFVLLMVGLPLGFLLVLVGTMTAEGILATLGTGLLLYTGWITTQLFGWMAGVGIVGLAGLLVLVTLFWIINRTPLGKKIVLSRTIDSTGHSKNPSQIGKTGYAVTDLLPSGKIEIEGTIHDAVSPKGFIPKGRKVTVQREDGFQLFVSEIEP